ncbi:MazG nucleotide pyrophosphohydrolase domain-containing protein [Phycisphaerales bacterium AB-hyl4]|uniref:MazG nucleotide pyrophosphohydrolase domain-containing protein n=1 Tax=Natronomicrosphaera hydrolytica TaxID=3242702 RepID=A0ABV4UA71_9BACT
MSNQPPTESDHPTPLTLHAFQQHIRDRYYETDAARGTPGTFMWLIEEVGELATALHKARGEGGATSGGENLEEEFADVVAWLCTLANINGVDLEQAIRRKYLRGTGPQGHK